MINGINKRGLSRKHNFKIRHFPNKGAYIKYVGGEPEETIDLNISWSSNFFVKYFLTRPISFSFLFKAYL